MTDVETLSERVRTVERAVSDGDHSFPEVDELADLTERLNDIEQRLDELEGRTAEQEAATQALRGYVGNVRSVNKRVEQRADTALAATERLERRLDAAVSQDSASEPGVELSVRATEPGAATDEERDTRPVGEHPSTAADGFDTGPTDNPTRSERDPGTDKHSGDAGVVERVRSLL